LIEGDTVSYIDLALDLWVEPGGAQTVLDEDELIELDLDQELLQKVYAGMHELQELLKTKNPPS
jgi:predicted RNA-binding protein associated with RNAse of E/G family